MFDVRALGSVEKGHSKTSSSLLLLSTQDAKGTIPHCRCGRGTAAVTAKKSSAWKHEYSAQQRHASLHRVATHSSLPPPLSRGDLGSRIFDILDFPVTAAASLPIMDCRLYALGREDRVALLAAPVSASSPR